MLVLLVHCHAGAAALYCSPAVAAAADIFCCMLPYAAATAVSLTLLQLLWCNLLLLS